MKAIVILALFTIFCTAILLAVLFLIGKSKKKRYIEDVIFLEAAVKNWRITKKNYNSLMHLFSDLYRNDQDKGRTYKLWEKFLTKYRDYLPAREKVLDRVTFN